MTNPIPWSTRRLTSHDKKWQCLALGDDLTHAAFQFPHLCTLPKGHFMPHNCWCGWNFTESHSAWVQPELPL